MPRNSESEPLLPTSNATIDAYQPSKATLTKITDAMAAVRAGKMPTQDQVSKALQELSNSSILDTGAFGRTGRFSAEGQLVIEDIRAFIDSLVTVGDEKNGDDKFQRFLYHSSQMQVEVETPDIKTSVSQREINKDSKKAAESLRTLGNVLITSPEFRNIISDATFLVRDLFADAATAAADAAKDAADRARPSEEERQRGVNVDVEAAKQKGKVVQKKLKTGRYAADALEKVVQAREWVDEKTDLDAKNEVIERLKKLVVSVQKNESYHSSINALLDLGKKYGTKAADAAKEAKDKTDIEEDGDAQQAVALLREILESIAGGKSLDGIIGAFDKVFADIKNDDRLKTYFDDLGAYIERLLHDEGYVLTQKANRKADEFVDRAQQLIESNEAWKTDSRALVDELKAYQQAVEDDRSTSLLVTNAKNLTEDLGDFGSAGINLFSAKAKGLYSDFYSVILPRVIDAIKQVPLPRLEYVSEHLDLAIDDFVLESASFVPDRIEVTNHNRVLLEQGYAAFAASGDASLRLRVKGLRFSARDIAYYVCAKSGWGWEDSGLLAIDLTDDGLSFDVELESATEEDRENFFTVKKVDVDIDGLNYSVSQSDHWFLNTILKPFARGAIHVALVKALESQITHMLQNADKSLFKVQQRAIGATKASPTPAGYLRALFASDSFFSSAKPSARSTQTGIVVTGPHGEWKLAVGADEMLLPGRGGPSAAYEKRKEAIEIAKRQGSRVRGTNATLTGAAYNVLGDARDQAGELSTEAKKAHRRELAQKGWQSQAFDV